MTKTLSLGFSPCPNDTFMFYNLVNNSNTLSFNIKTTIKDVEELNQLAINSETDITKLSFAAFFKVANNYKILNSGSALGRGCGPLVISKKQYEKEDLKKLTVAIPGVNTTANLLFSLYSPQTKNLKPMLFSDIEKAVLEGSADVGVIIHETRFTYKLRGLKKIADLGEWWEKETNCPIPLGCIAVKKKFEKEGKEFDIALKESIQYAFKNKNQCYPFIKQYARELDNSVIDSHIGLYVNGFSINLGDDGKQAITTLYEKAYKLGIVSAVNPDIFLTNQ
jgi:1,4-dihydroxy-6-naphthoate synthase